MKESNENILFLNDKINEEKRYWQKKLAGNLPQTNLLSYAYKTPSNKQIKRESTKIYITDNVFNELQRLGKKSDLSIYIILVAALKSLLHKYTGDEDLIILSPIYKPTCNQANVNEYVALRNDITGSMTFKDCILRIKDSTLEAYKNQDCPFDEILSLLNSNKEIDKWEIFNAICLLTNIHDAKPMENCRSNLVFAFERCESDIVLEIIYNCEVFEKQFMVQFSKHFISLLEHALENINESIDNLSLISHEEEKQLLYCFNETTVNYSFNKTINMLFEEQAEKSPKNTAVIFKNQSIEYGTLNGMSNHLARVLMSKGIGKGSYVPILMDNSLELVIAILSVMKTGAAFVPMDIQWPIDRIHGILKELNSEVVLVNNNSAFSEDVLSKKLILVDKQNLREDDKNLNIIIEKEDPIYVIYTSGSTGTPKGVIIPHKGIINRFLWMNDYFGISSAKSVLKTTNYIYDSSVWQLFWPLINGGKTVIPLSDKVMSVEYLTTIIEKHEITIIDFVPSVFNIIIDQLMEDELLKHKLESLQNIVIGGEEIVPSAVNKFMNFCPNVKITNLYGPTEASIGCIFHQVTREEGHKIPIGTPISNVKLLILDENKKIVPIGIKGEIYIAGVCLGIGYLNDKEKTDRVFIDNPFHQIGYNKLYKTGDIAYYAPTGDIYFCGRSDNQVKIRGLRIELGEIENQLLKYKQIKEAVVIAHDVGNDDKILCAYIVVNKKIEEYEIKNYLKSELPSYMIPKHFIFLDSIPLASSGKIDRKSLIIPVDIKNKEEIYTAPENETERKLQLIIKEMLKLNNISTSSDFFEMGGDSLKAITLITKIHKEFNVEISLKQIFTASTIKEISKYIIEAEKYIYSSIAPIEEKEYYLASAAQKRLYILNQLEGARTSYNISGAKEIEGNLDINKLEEIFRKIIKRQETLRTSFEFVDGELVQRIHKDVKFNVTIIDMKEDLKEHSENKIKRFIREFICPFDLSKTPLFRIGIINISENRNILIYDMHHIIADGISVGLLMNEFAKLYNGEELPELRIQYKDYAYWQNNLLKSEVIKKQEEYWINKFSDEIPVLNMPLDKTRPVVQSFQGGNISFKLGKELTYQLNKIVKETGTTMYMVLLSGINILIAKYSGQEDILIGTPIAGRTHADLQEIIGMFVNTLVMRNYPESNKTFEEFLNEVRENALEAYENQDFQFEELVDKLNIQRDISRNPLFDIAFAMQNMDQFDIKFNDLKFKEYEQDNDVSKFDLAFLATESENEILINIQYCSDIFTKETIERMKGHFIKILNAMVINRNVKLSEIDMLTEKEKDELLNEFCDTKVEFPKDKTIHKLFEEQVSKTPNNIAVAYDNYEITYKELNEKANNLSKVLIKKGVKSNSIVGIMVKESINMIIGILGILKAGGAYVPINPEYPENRVMAILNDSNASIVLTEENSIKNYSSIVIKGFNKNSLEPTITCKRPQICNFDEIPFPDRSLVNYEEYHKYIGQAVVKNSIAIQATRGCPYNCAYCHKIWPKGHVVRSPENILEEMKIYYNLGIRRFVIIDDIFNFNKENSSKVFKLIIENNMKIQIFFPNGVRGDVLTKEYIDLMIEAGVVGMAIALETASPRLQKLIQKNLNITRLKENIEYISNKYPHVILELFSMHGFPSETEEEARQTLDFIKSIKWLHFPYFHILKIYPGTDMANLAIENGVTEEAIERSVELAFHDLPDTLPFSKEFSKRCQTEFLNDYFLSKERMLKVLPYQMKILSEDEIIQKYNSYIDTEINSFSDLLNLVGISREELGQIDFIDNSFGKVNDLNKKLQDHFVKKESNKNAIRVLLLDLSQFFTSENNNMLYDVVEPPLGLMYLMTYLNNKHGSNICGKIAKSRIDFNSYDELKNLIEDFKPDVIGIRTLTYYRNFFHKVVTLIHQWGINVPIIAGGPYATSDYMSILKDKNVDMVILGEGEITLNEIINEFIKNNKKMPNAEVLKKIEGIAFVEERAKSNLFNREIIWLDQPYDNLVLKNEEQLINKSNPSDLAYIIYTSGTSDNPKGVMIEHRNVVRLFFNEKMQFDFNEKDIWTMFHSYCFDFSVWEMYGSLLYGGKLVLISRNKAADTEEFLSILKKEKVTILNQIPTPFYSLMNRELSCDTKELNLRYIIFGGEALKPKMLKEWIKKYPETKLINMYGITETTVHVTYKEIKEQDIDLEVSNIGKPIPTLSTYVMDKNLKLLPVGVAGELYVGGEGVARGYLNNRDLTEKKFLNNPYKSGERIYKSGDLVKILPNGDMQYLGRIDHQVKIRGFRIELGEIEHQLLKYKEITETVVIDRKDNDGTKYLCAYIVADRKLTVNELREHLSKNLPQYMIPSYFIQLDKVPFTSIGKIDRKALPEPNKIIETGNLYEEARNELEEKLTLIWKEILNVDKIGVNDSFFEIGGHSLKVTILVSKIHKEFNVKIPIIEIFKNPTINNIAKLIEAAKKEIYTQIEKSEDREYYKLSPAQARLYFLQQMNTNGVEYNTPMAVIIKGIIDENKIENTFKLLIKRHESLRTSFEVEENMPVQKIHDDVDFKINILKSEDMDIEYMIKRLIAPFDLQKPPLIRINLVEIKPLKYILLIDMHHIISDAMSINILLRDFIKLYNGEQLNELKLQYKDYSEWKNKNLYSKDMIEQEKYWLDIFKHEIPLLNIPTDYLRNESKRNFEGSSVSIDLDEELLNKIYDFIAEEQTTMYVFLLTTYNIILSKYSQQEDIIVGSPIEGRRYEELNNIIGMFVNMIALRNRPKHDKTFVEFLNEVKQNAINAFENQDYQFEELVKKLKLKRNPGRNPLFDVVLSFDKNEFHNIDINNEFKISCYEVQHQKTPFDLILKVTEGNRKLKVRLIYSKELFSEETIKVFSQQFIKVIEQIIENRNINLKDINLIFKENDNKSLLEMYQGDFNF